MDPGLEGDRMSVNRRQVLCTLAAASLLSSRSASTAAQSTPVATSALTPGYAIARVRGLPTPDLAAAIVPDVLANFLPRTAAVPGYAGYVLSAHAADPTAGSSPARQGRWRRPGRGWGA